MFMRILKNTVFRAVVCAAAAAAALYNGIACGVTLYKAGGQPYLMAGTVRFDFMGYYMMSAMHGAICLLLVLFLALFVRWTGKIKAASH